MIFETVVVGPLMVNCYVLGCEKSGEGVIVDPGDDAGKVVSIVSRHALKILNVINTHGHFDHTGGNRAVMEATGAGLLIHELDAPMLSRSVNMAARFGLEAENSPAATGFLSDGGELSFGGYRFTVLHTPGHTPGGCSLYGEGMLFTGDTLFADAVGRTDFPGGSASELMRSILEKLLVLPDATTVWPGHGPATTIGREKAHNPYISGRASL